MRGTVRKLFLLCTLLFLFTACHDRYESIYTDAVVPDKNYKPLNDTVLNDSVAHFLFSRLDTSGTYGLKLDYDVPKASQGKGLYVIVSGRTRTNLAYSNAIIAVSTGNKIKGQTSWDAIHMRYQFTDVNNWCEFKDSVRLPTNFWGTEYDHISVLATLPNSGEKFDLDGIHLTIKQIR